MNNTIVVGMGEALWDMLPEGKKIGGAPANFAYHVSQFGLDSRVVSAVGEDELGVEILKNFHEKKLNCMIETVPYPTGTVQVELDRNGVPCYDIREGVAWDNIPFTPALEGLARQTRAVCFGSLAQRSVVSRETINRFLVLYQGNHLRVDAQVQHPEDKRRGAGHHQPHVRLSGHRPAGQVLDSPCQVQPADAHPDLRRQRQLRLHAGRGVVCRDPEGGGCRHGRCRRFVYRGFRCLYPAWLARKRGAPAGGSHFGIRLHPERRDAGIACAADGRTHHRIIRKRRLAQISAD